MRWIFIGWLSHHKQVRTILSDYTVLVPLIVTRVTMALKRKCFSVADKAAIIENADCDRGMMMSEVLDISNLMFSDDQIVMTMTIQSC